MKVKDWHLELLRYDIELYSHNLTELHRAIERAILEKNVFLAKMHENRAAVYVGLVLQDWRRIDSWLEGRGM